MSFAAERGLLALVCINLGLQLFDGVATYIGLQAGVAEGNPLVAWGLTQLGPASGLALFKLQACACLLLLWKLRAHRFALPALVLSAVVYATCSLAPWTVTLARIHFDSYIAS
jgi:hypothetical protein